ncbi:MAG: hypothetical protein RLW62_12690 [Gammaproteobacteria bacterium]
MVVASMPPRGYFDEAQAVYRFDPARPTGIYTSGPLAHHPARWQVNAQGWLSTVDYRATRTPGRARIAVIGDSYVEALQVGTAAAFPSLLGDLLDGNPEVYAFGTSGAPLAHYLHLARHVAQRYDPDIIVINVVHNDFDESLVTRTPNEVQFLRLAHAADGTLAERAPAPNPEFVQYDPLKAWLRHSALVRYLYLNCHIKESVQALVYLVHTPSQLEFAENVNVGELLAAQPHIPAIVDYVVGAIARENRDRQVHFVIDGRRHQIYARAPHSRLAFLHDEMRAATRRHHAGFLDLHPHMARAYAADGRAFNSAADGHWNAYGHTFVARVLADYLAPHLPPVAAAVVSREAPSAQSPPLTRALLVEAVGDAPAPLATRDETPPPPR